MSYKFDDYSEVPLATPVEEIPTKVERVRKSFQEGNTRAVEKRLDLLRDLYYGLKDNTDILKKAIEKDLHRSPYETQALELDGVFAEIDLALNKLESWAKEKSAGWSGLKFMTTSPKTVKIPLGTVLIIAPWNYPLFLSITPIASAIAAGNTVVFKPSEIIPNTAQAVTKMLEKCLPSSVLQVVNGAIPETTALLEQKFDKILVTASGKVGRIVAQAAAKHSTPTILELGGKSPALVSASANIPITAKRLVWGKFVNAGQTCVAPDYLLVESSVRDQLVTEMINAIKEFYPNLSKEQRDYAHIPSERLFDRLAGLINNTQGKIVHGGNVDRQSLYIEPTIVTDIKADDVLMEDEIFGPILPIITVDNIYKDGVPFITGHHDTPLAMYVFTANKSEADSILYMVRSGGAIVNDTLLHVGMKTVPFGGVGTSGYGAYHGRSGFDAFSHERAVLRQPFWVDFLLKVRYPPYSHRKAAMMGRLSKRSEWYPRTGRVRKPLWRKFSL